MTQDYTQARIWHEKAAKWLRLAAEQGDPYSQFYLAMLYTNGLGVKKDLKQGSNGTVRANNKNARHADALSHHAHPLTHPQIDSQAVSQPRLLT
ncbi:SEL1-like repeat protein [Conservatibacter flavescens]|uniref:Sel1 repeat family protein n=1 Tax=Conservatibacter flavescens TaxID=28161 RepID=A0A2M8RZK7_9PAST|nr:hypothetical protein CVP05_12005 [Conservatibacter flavescens]